MEGHLVMSGKERQRLKVLAQVKQKILTLKEASQLLYLSYRQARRIYRRYAQEGDKGLIHKNRGKLSNHKFDPVFRQQVLCLYESKYPDFGPTLAAEKLAQNGHKLDHETLRRWLIAAGLHQKRRKRLKYRQWRERKAHFGELIQLDGSHHQWFEERGKKCCLMNLVDDATGTTMALLAEEETTEAAMKLLWQWLEKYGIPQALYTDHKNVYVSEREPSIEEQLKGETPVTQFGRACMKLGIRIITANSPQAKGRVERKHGVYQDRLVKELRLQKINSLAAANQFLKAGFLEEINRKFAKGAVSNRDYHKPLDKRLDLGTVFCLEDKRSVGNDWTVRYQNRHFQIMKQQNQPRAKQKVTVQERLDGSIHLVHKGREIEFTELSYQPKKIRVKQLAPRSRIKHVPPLNHPWRKSYKTLKEIACGDVDN